MEKTKVGSFFKNINPNQEKEAIEACYHIVGGKKAQSSGNAFLSSLWYGWNYTGVEVPVKDFHNITAEEFSAMTGGKPEWFEQIPNPFEEKEIVGGLLPELSRPLCFFDLETTGVDVGRDMIVEISVLKVFPNGTEESKTMLINPGIPIPKNATDVHGITDEMVKDKPLFVQISKGLLAFIEGCDIAGFNSNRFDVPMLAACFQRCGLTWNWRAINLIDVRNIFVQKEERTLSAGVKFYLGRDHDAAHSAEGDVLQTKNILAAQLSRYTDLPRDMKELAFFSNYGKEIIDLAGVFAKNDAGELVFTLGKHKGELAKLDKNYLDWIVNKSDFTKDTKEVAAQLIKTK